jgi:hypothetical protein
MKVEVLYVADCPTHPAAVTLIKDVLAAENIVADIQEVLVSDERMAASLDFPGSPTIRVNGRDVLEDKKNAENASLCCRLYRGSERIGLPPKDMVRKAVREAHQRSRT